jgi:hypothetical protein
MRWFPETRKAMDPKCTTVADLPAMFERIVKTKPTLADAVKRSPLAVSIDGSVPSVEVHVPCCRIIELMTNFATVQVLFRCASTRNCLFHGKGL